MSRQEWLAARTGLLAKEKAFTRLRDALNQARRDLPWVRVEKPYAFEGPNGRETLPDLFDGRSQLIVYHFMFAPESEAGCPHCSFWADNFNGIVVHLNHRDVTMVAISRAPYAKLAAYQQRMRWTFKWLSSGGSDFNYDFHASFTPAELEAGTGFYNFGTQHPAGTDQTGVSVFYRSEDGQVFQAYSAFSRGVDMLNVAYHYLDLVPKGRDEAGHARKQFWVRRHDEYEPAAQPLPIVRRAERPRG